MLHVEPVTLFSRRWDAEAGVDVWSAAQYAGHWYEHQIASVQVGGLQYANECRVRIPGSFDLPLEPGFRIFRGASEAKEPPPGSLEVVGAGDNRKGSLPHWLVIAK